MKESLTDNTAAVSINRRRFIRTVAGGIIVAANLPTMTACSSTTVQDASAAWREDYSTDSIVLWGLSYAILAPNPHNLQPWLVDVSTPGQMLVSIDPERLLPETDPFSRQIMIGTGAMLGLFELAVATRGYRVTTEWMAENSEDDADFLDLSGPLLRVTTEKDSTLTQKSNEWALFDQIRRRHTVRGNYDPSRIPEAAFVPAVTQFKANSESVGVVDRASNVSEFSTISDLVKEAWRTELSTPRTSLESMRLLRIGAQEINEHRDGIAIESSFLTLIYKMGLINKDAPLKVGSSAFNRQINEFDEAIDSTPGFFFITSDDNGRMDQVSVGRLFVKAQLKATESGLIMHPVSQGLQEYSEVAQTNAMLTNAIQRMLGKTQQTLQMLVRIGYLPNGANAPKPSPRRGVNAHLWMK